MKTTNLLYIAFFMLVSACWLGCESDLKQTEILADADIQPPVATNLPTADNLVLQKDAANEQLTFRWEKADYGVPVAAQYTIELDHEGNDFSEPMVLGSTTTDSLSMTVGMLNDKLLEFEIAPDEKTALIYRIKAELNYQVEVKYSQVLTLMVTPYTTNFSPIFMIGAALNGWDPAKAVEVPSTGEPKMYKTTVRFDADGDANFRFFSDTNWDASLGGYNTFTDYPTDYLAETGDGDSNFLFVGATGWYELTVNQALAKIELTPTSEPFLYLTGDATHGWDWTVENLTKLSWVGHQIWEGEVTFTTGKHFRFFEQKDWGPIGYGHDVIVDFDTNVVVIEEEHGDPNYRFVGESGKYFVRVDKRAGSVDFTKL